MNLIEFNAATEKHVVARITGKTESGEFNRLVNTVLDPAGNKAELGFLANSADLNGVGVKMQVAFEEVDPSNPLFGGKFSIVKIEPGDGISHVVFAV